MHNEFESYFPIKYDEIPNIVVCTFVCEMKEKQNSILFKKGSKPGRTVQRIFEFGGNFNRVSVFASDKPMTEEEARGAEICSGSFEQDGALIGTEIIDTVNGEIILCQVGTFAAAVSKEKEQGDVTINFRIFSDRIRVEWKDNYTKIMESNGFDEYRKNTMYKA